MLPPTPIVVSSGPAAYLRMVVVVDASVPQPTRNRVQKHAFLVDGFNASQSASRDDPAPGANPSRFPVFYSNFWRHCPSPP